MSGIGIGGNGSSHFFSVLDTARGYVACGLSVIPVRTDGSKAPGLPAGQIEQYRTRRPTDAELVGWFDRTDPPGIGIPGGPAGGHLVVLDFEQWRSLGRWGGAL